MSFYMGNTARTSATVDRDIVGYDVEATDGHIGKIDEASNEVGRAPHGRRHRLLDLRQEALDPSRHRAAHRRRRRKVYISMTKDQVKSAPDYDEQQRDYENDYDPYYEPFGR